MKNDRETSESTQTAPPTKQGIARGICYCLGWRKRILDLAVSLSLLLTLLLPLTFLSLILALRWRKCPFFLEPRAGRDRQVFDLWKFRTAAAGPVVGTAMPEPLAVSPDTLGPCLRRFGVDEIPQLWNVVRGEMSLVGPRPGKAGKIYKYRDPIRPGITGMWQIRGEVGRPIHRSPTYDLFYLRHASPRLDLWILCRTLRLVLGGRRLDYFSPSRRYDSAR